MYVTPRFLKILHRSTHTFHDCTLNKSPSLGKLSSPKITLPKTIAKFFESILFLSLFAATRARCSTIALSVAWCTWGNLRIFDLNNWKLFEMCSSKVIGDHNDDHNESVSKLVCVDQFGVVKIHAPRSPVCWIRSCNGNLKTGSGSSRR